MPSIGHRTRRKIPRPVKGTQWPSNSITYICGYTQSAFGPHDTDIGGSEQAVIQLSKCWASLGFLVVVYGTVKECISDGVEYRDIHRINLQDTFANAIFWRSFGIRLLPLVKAKKYIVDLHDSWDPIAYVGKKDLLKIVDIFMVKSNYHRSLYPYIPDSKIRIVMNGIQMNICESAYLKWKESVREPYRLIYASNYERGLEPILKFAWPRIIKAIPNAELHIYYGFQPNVSHIYMAMMKQLFKLPGVKEHGRVSLQKIAEEKCKSSIHLYVSNSKTEIDCISIRESLVCGAVPVIGTDFVFKERDGVHVSGSTSNIQTYRRAGSTVVKLLKNQALLDKVRQRLYGQTKTIVSWEEVARKWPFHISRA